MSKLDRIDYPVKQMPSGDWEHISLFRFQGQEPGPHVHIQANVHGAELQGNAVIYYLMDYFLKNQFKGSVTFIPCANPAGVNTKMGTFTQGRFNPITGDNWNRCYEDIFTHHENEIGQSLKEFVHDNINENWEVIKSNFKTAIFNSFKNYEKHLDKYGQNENKSLFLLLQKVAAPADIVLDLHTGPIATRYIYSAEFQKDSVKHFNFPFVLNIPDKFAGAMDEGTFINWVRLQRAFLEHGKDIPLEFESYTIELGSEEAISLEDAQKDATNILNYLHYKSIILEKPQIDFTLQRHAKLANFKTYYSPQGGMIEYIKGPGEQVNEGEIMAKILNFKRLTSDDKFDDAITELKCNKDCFIINHCPSGAISKGMELYQVLENSKEIEI